MGGNLEIYSRKEAIERDKIIKDHNEMVDQSLVEDGNSYSGCIGMFGHGIGFSSKVFEDQESAEEYIADTHEKYEPAMAVKYVAGADGFRWLIGGWVSS